MMKSQATVTSRMENGQGNSRIVEISPVKIKMLNLMVNPNQVEQLLLGALNRNFEWHVTFRSIEDRKRLLAVGSSRVMDSNGNSRAVEFCSMGKREVVVRVLWVPALQVVCGCKITAGTGGGFFRLKPTNSSDDPMIAMATCKHVLKCESEDGKDCRGEGQNPDWVYV